MSKGAYYQGLRYSNQGVKPVDFGASALNFAKEFRFQKEKRDEFLMEQQVLTFPSVDTTGRSAPFEIRLLAVSYQPKSRSCVTALQARSTSHTLRKSALV